jgi:hypothetical protein
MALLGRPQSLLPVETLWITEGQLPHLFEASKNGPPHLPFRIIGVPMQGTPDQDSK